MGSGKTTVLDMFRKHGAAIADADQIVHESLKPSGKAYRRVLQLLGSSILKEDETLDFKAMAELVFQESRVRESLESIVHPIVLDEFKKQIRTCQKPILILDIPLLFEAGWKDLVDRVVVVWTPSFLRLQRLLEKKRFSKKDLIRRFKVQIPLRKKRLLADFVIDNSGSKNQTQRQVSTLWKDLQHVYNSIRQ
ncbi:MAG: dephospho-CoA kinase [Elusimicrobia bacterium]|nr:dephospho-CoA kinase [Elusimicrobiota bacterium]